MIENYLAHYGIPGMRWGHRRYHMSLPSVRKRDPMSIVQVGGVKGALTSVSSGADAGKRIANLVEKTKPKKDLSKMTDDDLKKMVSRMNLERQYRDLSSVDKSKGADITRNILEGIGAVTAIGASAASIVMAIKAIKG